MDNYLNLHPVEKVLFSRAAQNNTPISGSLELLPLCNMNCDMCYVRLSPKELSKQGNLHTADEWISLAYQMKERGVLFLLLTGGEPLLYRDFKKLYLALLEMGIIVSINTNGTLLTSEWASFFGQHKPRRINISLYGSSEQIYRELCHYPEGYSKTLRAITLLKQNHIDVKLNFTAARKNAAEIKSVLSIAEEMNLPVTIDTYMIPAIRERNKPFDMQTRLSPQDAATLQMNHLISQSTSAEFLEFREEILSESNQLRDGLHTCPTEVSCLAGICSFSIAWNGKMHSCITLTHPEADVFDIGFDKSWRYLVSETSKLHINSHCATCLYRPVCKTCIACAMAETGCCDSIPKYMCEYAKKSFDLISSYTGCSCN